MSVRLETATGTVVGLIGLGAMGVPVAEHLIAAGHPVVGFDIASDRIDAFEVVGGLGAASVEEVATRSQAVLTLLPSAAALADVCDGLVAAADASDGPRPDVIELSTLGYETKAGARQRLASAGDLDARCGFERNGRPGGVGRPHRLRQRGPTHDEAVPRGRRLDRAGRP